VLTGRRAARRVHLSVVTYSYKDHGLVCGLLRSVGGWSVVPRELIVVDDGSDTPFPQAEAAAYMHVSCRGSMAGQPDTPEKADAPEKAGAQVKADTPDKPDVPGAVQGAGHAPAAVNAVPLRVVIHGQNRGPTGAKQSGISAATSRFVLSMDSDTRLEADWLEHCLPLAAQEDTGMVSTPVEYRSGDGSTGTLTDEYMRLTYSFAPARGDVPMIPGPVFLMRKAVFDGVGGFAGYGERLGEDRFLCERLTAAGYRLRITDASRAWQMRRLSRTTAVRRGLVWQANTFLEQIEAGVAFSDITQVFLYSVGTRPCARMVQAPGLVYHDMLYAVYGLMRFAARYEGARQGLAAFLRSYLRDCSALLGVLADDLRELDIPLHEGQAAEGATFPAFAGLFPPAVCAAMDAVCAQGALHGAGPEDFSMYRHMGA